MLLLLLNLLCVADYVNKTYTNRKAMVQSQAAGLTQYVFRTHAENMVIHPLRKNTNNLNLKVKLNILKMYLLISLIAKILNKFKTTFQIILTVYNIKC